MSAEILELIIIGLLVLGLMGFLAYMTWVIFK